MNALRVIIDTPRGASLNMAIDEMLLEEQSAAEALPTLRFYTWEKPAISAGYFENVGELADRYAQSKEGAVIVRRLTGGGIVFHGRDLTFSLTAKAPGPFFPSEVKTSYLKINEAVRLGLRARYPDVDYADCKTVPSVTARQRKICFEAPACYDLLLKGKKILGASQRRMGGTALHQSALFLPDDKELLAEEIMRGFLNVWKTEARRIPLNAEELQRAEKKEKDRYSLPDWAASRRAAAFFS